MTKMFDTEDLNNFFSAAFFVKALKHCNDCMSQEKCSDSEQYCISALISAILEL